MGFYLRSREGDHTNRTMPFERTVALIDSLLLDHKLWHANAFLTLSISTGNASVSKVGVVAKGVQ